MEAEVKVGIGCGVEVGAAAVCGRDVGGAGVSVAAVPQATTPRITVATATPRIEARNRDISEV